MPASRIACKKKKITTTYDFWCVTCKLDKIRNSHPNMLIFDRVCSGKGVIWHLKWQYELAIFASKKKIILVFVLSEKNHFSLKILLFTNFLKGKVHCTGSLWLLGCSDWKTTQFELLHSILAQFVPEIWIKLY